MLQRLGSPSEIVPGGIATTLLVLVLTGTRRRCQSLSTANPATGALVGRASAHCTPSTGPSSLTTAWHITLVVLFVVGTIISAVCLARRARIRSVFMSPQPSGQ